MATIPEITDRLEAATIKAEESSEIQYQVANGDANTSVPTASGPTPSIKKWFQELGSTIDPMLAGIPARLDKAILFYETRDDAITAAASLPDYQVIVIKSDESQAIVFGKNITQEKSIYSVFDYEKLANFSGEGDRLRVKDNSGIFWWTKTASSSANGITIISDALGRSWAREYSGPINVKWAGAKGDGITDDTFACQKAIDVCYELNAGEVFFPSGVYSVTSIVRSWSDVRSVTIRGSGKKSTVFIKYGSGTDPIFNWSANTDILETYSDFHDFSIFGTNKTHDGIKLLRCARFSMSNLDIRSCNKAINNIGALVWTGEGLTLQGNNYGLFTEFSPAVAGVSIYPNAITLKSCQIISNTAYGIFGNYANGLRLRDCNLEHNGTAGNESSGALIIGGTSTEFGIGSASIDGCWFEANKGWSIILAGGQSSGFNISDSLIVNSESGNAILVQSASHLTISNVDAISPSDRIWIQAASQTTISDSTVSTITDGSTRSTWRNVITSRDPIGSGGFNRGVDVSNGSSLKLTWANGSGVHELKPDPGTGTLLVKTQAKYTIFDGALGIIPRSISGIGDNTLFVDSSDGKLKFRNRTGVVTVIA